MKFVLIIGEGATGKMTVGQELMKITELRLFHNHMPIEPVLDIFGAFNGTAIDRIRAWRSRNLRKPTATA